MGLDSVELVVSFEKYFQIEIPDTMAEKMVTLQDFVDGIAKLMNISDDYPYLQELIFRDLRKITNKNLQIEDLVLEKIEISNLDTLSKALELEIPEIHTGEKLPMLKCLIQKYFGYDYKKVILKDFILSICAKNHQLLVDPRNIRNKYEILVVIAALLVDKCGVDYYEIQPHKSFTNDFGID